jgi:hypothetical protein
VRFQEILELLWLAAVAAHVVWAARLYSIGVIKQYPVLTSFLLFSVAQSGVGFLIYRYAAQGLASSAYAWFWVVSRLLTFTLYFCVLVEIGRRMLAGYRGFERLGQFVIFGSLAGVGALIALTVLLHSTTAVATLKSFWFLEERSIYLGLTATALVLAAFGSYFRLRPPRNVQIMMTVFGVLFAGEAVLWSLRGHFGNMGSSPFDLFGQLLYLVCPIAGAWAFSKAGEQQLWKVQFKPVMDAETEAVLAEKLSSYNQTLLRVLRS